jgi:hypothetical protein
MYFKTLKILLKETINSTKKMGKGYEQAIHRTGSTHGW